MIEGYVLKNKKTGLYLKKGSRVSWHKLPHVFNKINHVGSSITNKIKYNSEEIDFLKDLVIEDLMGNIINSNFKERALKILEDKLRVNELYPSTFTTTGYLEMQIATLKSWIEEGEDGNSKVM